MKLKIIFHENQLGYRGTTVSTYDYAHYNETILRNESYIAVPESADMSARNKFYDRFGDRLYLYPVNPPLHFLQGFVDYIKADVVYQIISGEDTSRKFNNTKNVYHAVFNVKNPEITAYVSEWLSEQNDNYAFVPHIVSLPNVKGDYREFLSIPDNALVFGRYGGFSQFDIPYLTNVIEYVVNQRPNAYFLLMNTKHLDFDHPRVIYTDATTDLEQKRSFLNTCNAFITGRTDGESFGLSIAEACFANLPVITNSDGRDKNHLYLLKDKGYYYESANELYAVLMNFQKRNFDYTQLVKEFTPDIVMQKFKEVFLC